MEKYVEIHGKGFNVPAKFYCHNIRDLSDVIVCVHGFAGHKDNAAAARLADRVLTKYKRSAVFCFDLPCHGDDVKPLLKLSDCDVYISAVIDYLHENYPGASLYNYSTSFGGYLSMKYALEHGNPFKKLLFRCPAVYMHEVIGRTIAPGDMEKLEKGREILAGFDRKVRIGPAFLEELRAFNLGEKDLIPYCEDMVIMHGTKDEIVPFDAVSKFADDNIIEFIPVKNADHRFTDPGTMTEVVKKATELFKLH